MTTFKEEAEKYEPTPSIKNISELSEVSADVVIKHDGQGLGNDGKPYSYSYIEIGEHKYKVPKTAYGQFKEILKVRPDCKTFKVSRVGTTKDDTRYTVIPLS